MVTAPGSGAEVIPFLKTYVNLPMAIGFTVIYAQVQQEAVQAVTPALSFCHHSHAVPALPSPVQLAGCRALLLPPLLLHSVLPTSVQQPAPAAASNCFCACCSWPMCSPQRRCSTPASSPSLPSSAHLPSSCTPCGMCSTPTVSLTAACRCLLAWGQLAGACVRLQCKWQHCLQLLLCCFPLLVSQARSRSS